MFLLIRHLMRIPVLSAVPEGMSSAADGARFLAQAMQDSLAEIEACEMALQKTSNADVKAFSQHMIDQHGQMGREIEQLASRKHLSLPDDVTSEQKSTCEQLSKLSGKEFDRKFMEHNIEDHEKDIKTFSEQAPQIADDDIRAFAEKGVRQLGEHLKMARDVDRRLQA